MKLYEITYLIPASSSEDEIKDISSKITGNISEIGGKTEKTFEPVKKSLGFKLSKQKEVLCVSIAFSLDAKNLESFSKKIKSDSRIIRYNIIKKQTLEQPQEKEFVIRRREEKNPEKEMEELSGAVSKPKKVELKEIDQKIEEILNE